MGSHNLSLHSFGFGPHFKKTKIKRQKDKKAKRQNTKKKVNTDDKKQKYKITPTQQGAQSAPKPSAGVRTAPEVLVYIFFKYITGNLGFYRGPLSIINKYFIALYRCFLEEKNIFEGVAKI